MKILLVDDTLSERMFMATYLKNLGHEVICGENGEDAVEIYRQQTPDLVLIDVNMPRMNGYQAANRIRALDQDDWVPIIFLSAKKNPEDIADAITAGGDDYLTKPPDETVLAAKMAAMQRIAAMRGKLIDVSQQLERANTELQRLAEADGLTGLANRRHLDQHLEREAANCARRNQPLSLIMLDLDHFKAYNDHYGHLAGDSCLRKISKILKRMIRRPSDLAGRFGGEEFCIVLPDTPPDGACHVAESLRHSVEQLALPHAGRGNGAHVTLSLGVASQIPEPGCSVQQYLVTADKALYQAKQAGRNQVVLLPIG